MQITQKDFEISKQFLDLNKIFIKSSLTKKVYDYLETIINNKAINNLNENTPVLQPVKNYSPAKPLKIKFDPIKFHKAIIPKHSTLPILSYFAVKNGEQISTDLEVYGITTSDLIPGLYQYLNTEIATSSEPLDDFPLRFTQCIETQKYNVIEIEIPAETLTAIKRALSCASYDDLKYPMNSICFDIKNNLLCIVATDGHRLTKNTFNINSNYIGQLLIPLKTLRILTRFCSTNYTLKIYLKYKTRGLHEFTPERIEIVTNDFTLESMIKDDTYLNYNSVIPDDYKAVFKFNKAELITALKSCILYSDYINKIVFERTDGGYILNACDHEKGLSKTIPVSCPVIEIRSGEIYENQNYDIAFNGKYLIENLQNIKSNYIYMRFLSHMKAFILYGNYPETLDNLTSIMPLRNI